MICLLGTFCRWHWVLILNMDIGVIHGSNFFFQNFSLSDFDLVNSKFSFIIKVLFPLKIIDGVGFFQRTGSRVAYQLMVGFVRIELIRIRIGLGVQDIVIKGH